MKKVNLDVIKPWISNRITELLGFEDEVVIDYTCSLLEEKVVRSDGFFVCRLADNLSFSGPRSKENANQPHWISGKQNTSIFKRAVEPIIKRTNFCRWYSNRIHRAKEARAASKANAGRRAKNPARFSHGHHPPEKDRGV